MRRMFPIVWSSLSRVNDAAFIIFVSLSYETLERRKLENKKDGEVERSKRVSRG